MSMGILLCQTYLSPTWTGFRLRALDGYKDNFWQTNFAGETFLDFAKYTSHALV